MTLKPSADEAAGTTEAELKRWETNPPDDDIQQAWKHYHEANPKVYDLLVRFTREAIKAARERGRDLSKFGIQAAAERARWFVIFELEGEEAEDFKLSNSYLSRYAREIMTREPDLRGVFELRSLRPVIHQPNQTKKELSGNEHDRNGNEGRLEEGRKEVGSGAPAGSEGESRRLFE